MFYSRFLQSVELWPDAVAVEIQRQQAAPTRKLPPSAASNRRLPPALPAVPKIYGTVTLTSSFGNGPSRSAPGCNAPDFNQAPVARFLPATVPIGLRFTWALLPPDTRPFRWTPPSTRTGRETAGRLRRKPDLCRLQAPPCRPPRQQPPPAKERSDRRPRSPAAIRTAQGARDVPGRRRRLHPFLRDAR